MLTTSLQKQTTISVNQNSGLLTGTNPGASTQLSGSLIEDEVKSSQLSGSLAEDSTVNYNWKINKMIHGWDWRLSTVELNSIQLLNSNYGGLPTGSSVTSHFNSTPTVPSRVYNSKMKLLLLTLGSIQFILHFWDEIDLMLFHSSFYDYTQDKSLPPVPMHSSMRGAFYNEVCTT